MENVNSRRSSQSTSTAAPATSHLRSTRSSTPPVHAKRYSEPTPSRHRRMLDSRNAKFPAKKLSISNLSSRFSQLIHSNEEPQSQPLDKENVPFDAYEYQNVDKVQDFGSSLGILEEVSTSLRSRKAKRSENIAIYKDTPERPLLERSPLSSPARLAQLSPEDYSPIGFDHIHDTLGNMRLRNISGNEYRGSPLASSPASNSMKAFNRRKSTQLKSGFDTIEYIEHIEKQLEEAKNEMFSPTTNKSLKDQLKIARHDNDRLREEMAEMQDMYEAEMKRAIEQRAEMEVDLRRRVRDLEDELEQKTATIQNLELQHDERRLDSNTIDTFKATIEKLEHDRYSLEDENRSVSKRNEVLSELLAMSPTRLQSFELRSPVRERRGNGRPMSLIIPKLPSSPKARQVSQPTSIVPSPSVSSCESFFGPAKSRTGSPQLHTRGLGLCDVNGLNGIGLECNKVDNVSNGRRMSNKGLSRRSTLQSESSYQDTTSMASFSSSPGEQTQHRQLPKRKPRKFMAGSTQLKPLLLPALTSDGMPLSATSSISSPQVDFLRNFSEISIDPTTCFLSRSTEGLHDTVTDESIVSSVQDSSDLCSDNTKPVYNTFEEIIAEHRKSLTVNELNDSELDVDVQSSSCFNNQVGSPYEEQIRQPATLSVNSPWNFTQSNRCESTDYFGSFVSGFEQNSSRNQHVPIPRSSAFDLNALSQLELPDPAYDDLPDTSADADETIILDVPQPLFSIHRSFQQGKGVLGFSSSHPEVSKVRHNHLAETARMSTPDCELRDSPVLAPRHIGNLVTSAKKRRYSQSLAPAEYHDVGRSRTPQRSLFGARDSLTSTKSPIDILRPNRFGAQPLASLTIRTIFGTISKCTGSVRDFKRDPLALARRVIANAWFSNWTRFGKLSWWVLGLFIRSGIGGPKAEEWKWDTYDGEEIARRVCEENNAGSNLLPSTTTDGMTHTYHNRIIYAEQTETSAPSIAQKNGWSRSVMLWGKFSVAIMLAVGGAVVKGPEEMLREIDGSESTSREEHRTHRVDDQQDHGCRGSSCHARCARSQMNASQDMRLSRYNYFPSPFASRGTSISSLKHGLTSSTVQEDCCSVIPAASHHFSYDNEDDTLRAVRSPRPHVAEFFHRSTPSHSGRLRNFSEASSIQNSSLTHFAGGSIDDTLQWPPSPGPIDSQGNHSFC